MTESKPLEGREETPSKNFIIFAEPRAASSIVLTVIDFAILFIYFEGYKLDSILVGVSLMCGKFAIAISQFSLGYLSDTVKLKRLGKRKPFMIFGSPLLGLSFVMLLLPTLILGESPGQLSLFIWLLVFDVMFQFMYGAVTTPYQSWMAEQFKVSERPKASAFQNIFNYLGTGIAALFTYMIVPEVMADFGKTKEIHPLFILTVILFAVITVGMFYISAFLLPVESSPPIEANIKEDVKNIIDDRNYLQVCVMVGIASLTWSMITGIMLSYVQIVLKLGSSILGFAGLAIGVLSSLFVWMKIIGKFGKKTTLQIIFLWAILTIPLAGILPLLPFEDFTVPAVVLVIVVSASLGGWFLFPYIVYADLAENNKKSKENELKAGLYTGFPSILLNLFQAFGLLITGILLALPDVPGTDYSWGYLLWAPLGSLILIIALFYLRTKITLDFEWEGKET